MRFVLLSLLFATAAQAQVFIPDMPDIPLPDEAESESVFDFDTENTHLTQVMVYTSAPSKATLQFYDDTLPQLGWQPAGPHRFVRDADTLTIEPVSQKEGTTAIRVELKVTNK